jgi:hypothetical protein
VAEVVFEDVAQRGAVEEGMRANRGVVRDEHVDDVFRYLCNVYRKQ